MVKQLDPVRARAIGEAARKRVLADHTYEGRGGLVEAVLNEQLSQIRHSMEMNV